MAYIDKVKAYTSKTDTSTANYDIAGRYATTASSVLSAQGIVGSTINFSASNAAFAAAGVTGVFYTTCNILDHAKLNVFYGYDLKPFNNISSTAKILSNETTYYVKDLSGKTSIVYGDADPYNEVVAYQYANYMFRSGLHRIATANIAFALTANTNYISYTIAEDSSIAYFIRNTFLFTYIDANLMTEYSAYNELVNNPAVIHDTVFHGDLSISKNSGESFATITLWLPFVIVSGSAVRAMFNFNFTGYYNG